MSLLPSYRGAMRTVLFILGYLWNEVIGLVSLLGVWIRHRNPARFLDANNEVQRKWAERLFSLGAGCFSVKFEVEGEDELEGEPPIFLLRHTSIADTVLPIVYYSGPRSKYVRYVMKQELLWDPCLDVAGNRLPNVFVDRSGQDSAKAIGQIETLVRNMQPDDALVFYPEGTRFSEERRQQLIDKGGEIAEMASTWTDLLPPRLGGTTALLESNPERDVVFVAHKGFEGSSHFSNLINGSWIGTTVRIRFWRVPFKLIPKQAEAIREFLMSQWHRMQREIDAMVP